MSHSISETFVYVKPCIFSPPSIRSFIDPSFPHAPALLLKSSGEIDIEMPIASANETRIPVFAPVGHLPRPQLSCVDPELL